MSITDIWVDSEDSQHGGRDLWAIPKGLAAFRRHTTGARVERTSWGLSLDGRPVVSARFTDVSRMMLRTKFRRSTGQVRPEDHPEAGDEVVAHLRRSSRTLPCRNSWQFAEDGPLGWLGGKRSVASFRMADFEMAFG